MDTIYHLLLIERDHELEMEHVRFEVLLRYLGDDVNKADIWTVYISLFKMVFTLLKVE